VQLRRTGWQWGSFEGLDASLILLLQLGIHLIHEVGRGAYELFIEKVFLTFLAFKAAQLMLL